MTSPQCTVAVKTADIALMGTLLKLPESIHKAKEGYRGRTSCGAPGAREGPNRVFRSDDRTAELACGQSETSSPKT